MDVTNHRTLCYSEQLTGDVCSVAQFSSVQFSPVAQPCPTLCDPMNRIAGGILSPSENKIQQCACFRFDSVSIFLTHKHSLN